VGLSRFGSTGGAASGQGSYDISQVRGRRLRFCTSSETEVVSPGNPRLYRHLRVYVTPLSETFSQRTANKARMPIDEVNIVNHAALKTAARTKRTMIKRIKLDETTYDSTGTGTAVTISLIKSAVVLPRSCAWGAIIRRWLKTRGAMVLISSGSTKSRPCIIAQLCAD
jgi:hypothetical protein